MYTCRKAAAAAAAATPPVHAMTHILKLNTAAVDTHTPYTYMQQELITTGKQQ
jgi:hypothetical protein